MHEYHIYNKMELYKIMYNKYQPGQKPEIFDIG